MTEKLESISSTAISDSTGGLNNMHPRIKPLKEDYKKFVQLCL